MSTPARIQLRDDDRLADQPGQFSVARESRHQQQGFAARDGELSAEQHRCRERVRIRRFNEHVDPRRVDDMVASVQPVPDAADRISVPAPDERFDAALCQSRERIGRRRALPATIRSRSTGARRRSSSRAASPALERASTRGRTARSTGSRPKRCGVRAAAITSRSAARFGRKASNVFGQQNARGTFNFNGSLTGSDLADFLLGSPHSAALAFGNADKSSARPVAQRLYHGRLAHQPHAHGQPRASMGIRSAVQRGAWPPGESRRGAGLHCGDAGRRRRSSSRTDEGSSRALASPFVQSRARRS